MQGAGFAWYTLRMKPEPTETPVWSLTPAQWAALIPLASSSPDALKDGAFVCVGDNPENFSGELLFFATARNKPSGWRYPFLEAIPRCAARGAFVGFARHEAAAGLVQFEVVLLAAAQELAADYESGASDLDFVSYEQAVEQAIGGTPADLAWLHQEFGRLALRSLS